ncbi:MAG: GDP-mannose 4,6-dehydratase, partial [Gammaproteobacteria bacterium]|nr:GDP-mannose 4,6-dehydratase [Gammaproteobacteria bacterium]
YSNSKGCSELVTSAYRQSYFQSNRTAVASARAGNVIGGGDWAADRLVPDILRAFEAQKPVIIRNPSAIRPWQHVLEPLSGYLLLAERLCSDGGQKYAEAWNFGPNDSDVKPVQWIVEQLASNWGSDAKWQIDKESHPHEAQYLKLDISKAKMLMQWTPTWDLKEALNKINEWHHEWRAQKDMQQVCLRQIAEFSQSKSGKV